MLTIANGYIVFTTGAAVHVASNAAVPKNLALGRYVRVRIDTATHDAIEAAAAPNSLPGDIDADHIPANLLAGNSAQRRAEPGAASAELVAVTIEVLVPPSTPAGDDIYLTTERTSFSPAELKMTRLDAQRWSIQLSVPSNSVMHYRFTRGSNTTAERDSAGIINEPHALTAKTGLHTHDTVQRWADQT